MQINADKLNYDYVKNNNIYLVYGEEILLVESSVNFIKAIARKQQFNERIRFDIDSNFDWSDIYQELNSTSLFSNKQIIECYMSINSENTNNILQMMQNISDDIIIIFIVRDISSAQKKSKWFETINNSGLIVANYLLKEQETKNWIINKAQQLDLNIDDKIISSLLFNNEGNLFAISQEIQKLKLAYAKESVDYDSYCKQVEQQSYYKPFGLVNASLLGDSKKVIKIQQILQENGTEAMHVINILINELKILIKISVTAKKTNINEVIAKYHFWYEKENTIKKALARNNTAQIQKIIISLGKIERNAKGYGTQDVWSSLLKLLLNLSGKKIWME